MSVIAAAQSLAVLQSFKVESLKKAFPAIMPVRKLHRLLRLELLEHSLKDAASFDSFDHLTVDDRCVEKPLVGIAVKGACLGHL
jgi:hypothetical protein